MQLKSIIKSPFRSLLRWAPELLFVLFLLCLAPLLVMTAASVYSWLGGAVSDFDTFLALIREDYRGALAGSVCVVGGLFIFLIFFRCRRNIWAVARKMILEALNRKAVIILLLFFVVLMPSLPFILRTEGSLKSQVQIVLTYSLALAEMLLSVLAIFVCTASVCSEITKKQVHITDTKPLFRWQFLFGKLAGVTILCGVLLFLMSGAVFGIVQYMVHPRVVEGRESWETAEEDRELARVRNEVMVARRTVMPSTPDTGAYVETRIEEKRERGEIATAADEAGARKELRAEAIRRRATAVPNGVARFEFSGLDRGSRQPLYIRAMPHKTNPDADHLCPGVWLFFHPRPDVSENDDSMRLVGEYEHQLAPGVFQEIAVSPRMIDRNGVLRLAYYNTCSDTGVLFAHEGGIEVMQEVGGFTLNFYRSVTIVLAHIILLAALSIMLGAMFSFPVASFCVVSVLVIGLLGPWVVEHALGSGPAEGASGIGFWIREGLSQVLRWITVILPQFGRFSPIERVANGRLVGLGYTATAASIMIFLQGGVAMLLAVYFYCRRELAKIIV